MKRFITGLLLALCIACHKDYKETQIPLDVYTLEPGFSLQAVAAEPLLTAPVAMDFDNRGRMWVVEMPSFMANIEGTGEELPTGSIKILEDLDQDGVADHAKTFMDSLVMPRALAHVYDGLLYAEPPKLWFVEIEDDKPVNKVLVDSVYAPDGNPEHQPNGLLVNVDNWIYNAKSNFRYQRKDGKWIKEPTTFRGQWGISHDNFGRLYFNDNSTQLKADHVLPNRLIRNPYYTPRYGVRKKLTDNQRVYPLNPATVNRGYIPGVLDADSLLIHVTAACGPLVYIGGNFPEGYDQNAFVCVPEANLIKRNLIRSENGMLVADQAWDDKEFLASTDEGFRPVNMNVGPDGALYVVDMHRGVIGHHAYLTPYMKKKSLEKQLDTLVNAGRILKISKEGGEEIPPIDLETASGQELVGLLQNENGWLRTRAQHLLVYRQQQKVVPLLEDLAQNNELPWSQIHALHTLEGLDALNPSLLLSIAGQGSPEVVAHAIILLEKYASPDLTKPVQELFERLLTQGDPLVVPYVASSLGSWAEIAPDIFLPMFYELSVQKQENNLYTDALMSGTANIMDTLYGALKKNPTLGSEKLFAALENSITLKEKDKPNFIFTQNGYGEDTRTKGAKLFRQICASCHGSMGEGIEDMAPPLVGSEYLGEKPERMALIMLHGLKGPVHVNDSLYEFNHAMPGLVHNHTISDKDIVDIISYISNAYSEKTFMLKTDKVKELRSQAPSSGAEYTEKELEALFE